VGVFIGEKNPENAKLAIAGAILEVRENLSGASDKARGGGGGRERKTARPKTPLL